MKIIDCPECRGAGELIADHFSGDPQCERLIQCPRCLGDGEIQIEEDEDDAV